jgi:hypothetical protein
MVIICYDKVVDAVANASIINLNMDPLSSLRGEKKGEVHQPMPRGGLLVCPSPSYQLYSDGPAM